MLPSSLFYLYFKHLKLPRSYLMLMLLAEVTDGFRPRQNLFNQNKKEIEIILTFSFDCQLAPRGSLPCSCYPFLDKHLIPRFPHAYPFKV